MKLILLFVLTILLLSNLAESKSSQQELIIESVKLWNSIKELWKRFEHKCQEKIRKYLEEDDLGEKIADVLKICTYTSKNIQYNHLIFFHLFRCQAFK
ncbi:unnamed protein product [Schistosoma curassoni]|nr:unnamed protein product [Schistosoma curassoni]